MENGVGTAEVGSLVEEVAEREGEDGGGEENCGILPTGPNGMDCGQLENGSIVAWELGNDGLTDWEQGNWSGSLTWG